MVLIHAGFDPYIHQYHNNQNSDYIEETDFHLAVHAGITVTSQPGRPGGCSYWAWQG